MEDIKLIKLQSVLKEMGSVLVAFSGGMDSSFLLKVAKNVLQDKVLAVTADSEVYSSAETESTKKVAEEIGVKHIIVKTSELKNKDFVKNSTDRCFHCKLSLYGEFIKIANEFNINHVIDGINYDDRKDFRPGMSAAKKLKIRSPLLEAGLTKQEISALSKEMHLSTWNKAPNPCLSTRFPYGTKLMAENLSKVEQAELALEKFNFKQLRLRIHDDNVRIEVIPEDLSIVLVDQNRKEIIEILKGFKYNFITLDLEGYRMGSMNERFRPKIQNLIQPR